MRVGVLVRVEAKAGKGDELAARMRATLPAIEDEPGTTAWFALRLSDTSFAVCDAFHDEAARDAHMKAGRVRLDALADLLAAPPDVAFTEVVAAKVPGERPPPRAENLRAVWEHLISHQATRDIDGWVNCFALDGVMEFPFRLKGVPARLEGRQAIRAGLGPTWERAKKSNRRILGHENVVFHQTTDPEVAIIEFDIVGENARGPFRQAVVYLLRARAGSVLLLRDFLDTAALNELFQVG